MIRNRYFSFFVFITFFVYITGCTENPFFDDEVNVESNLSFSGRVNIPAEENSGGVFVWMEGLDLHTFTEPDGSFVITLPREPQLQSGGGLTGFYKVYYYVQNYRISSSDVFLFKGQFEYGLGDLTRGGRLISDVSMKKLLDIKTTTEPSIVDSVFSGSFDVVVSLENKVDSVIVETYKTPKGDLGQAFLRNTDPAIDTSFILRQSSGRVQEVIDSATVWSMTFFWEKGWLEEGRYEIIPFLEVKQEGIPQGLLSRFRDAFRLSNLEFFEIPSKQRSAILTVRN